jgi:hypothetical protein
MEIFWYRKKSLTDYIGATWKPNIEFYSLLDEALFMNKPESKKPIGDTFEKDITELYDYSKYLN